MSSHRQLSESFDERGKAAFFKQITNGFSYNLFILTTLLVGTMIAPTLAIRELKYKQVTCKAMQVVST